VKVHWQIRQVAETPAAVFCYFTDRFLSWLLLPNPNKLCTRLQSSARHGRARTRASTNASHPSTTITTSIEMEEPSQPSCCDMFATSRSLSSCAGYPALCIRLPVKQGRRTQPAACLARSIAIFGGTLADIFSNVIPSIVCARSQACGVRRVHRGLTGTWCL